MREQGSDRVLDRGAEGATFGPPMRERLLAVPHKHLVQVLICAGDMELPRLAIEEDLIPVFPEIDRAPNEAFELGRHHLRVDGRGGRLSAPAAGS